MKRYLIPLVGLAFLVCSIWVAADWDDNRSEADAIISGGTANYIAKFGSGILSNSQITDDGSDINMTDNVTITEPAGNQLTIKYDAAAYTTFAIADGAGFTIDNVSDGTAQINLSDNTSITGWMSATTYMGANYAYLKTAGADPTVANDAVVGADGVYLEGSSADTSELVVAWPTMNPASDITVYCATSKQGTTGAGVQGASKLPLTPITEVFHVRHDEFTAEATTQDIVVVTLPARAVIQWPVLIVVTEQGACCSGGDDSLTLSLGSAAANYDEIVIDSDGEAAANTVYGDAQDGSETGTDIDNAGAWYPGKMYSWTTAQAITLHVDTNAANVNTVTAGEYDIVVTYVVVPTYGE